MKALVYHDNEDIRVEEVPRPVLGDPGDAVIRVTSAAICGSDLHLYHGDIPDLRDGDVLRHESMGIVEEVGPEVRSIKPGDRVVISAIIADGTCWFCQQGSQNCAFPARFGEGKHDCEGCGVKVPVLARHGAISGAL